MILDTYLNRVPSQHRNKPKFRATLEASLSPFVQFGNLMESVPSLYDVDTAIGSQLDVVGEWVGVTRVIKSAIEGVYFALDDTADVGFDSGIWRGAYDPISGIVSLDDDTYRTLIKLKILANMWDGTAEKAYSSWQSVFNGEQGIVIEDHQDMSITIGITGLDMTPAQKGLFSKQISPFKPAGVRISTYFVPSETNAPFFALDTEGPDLAGFDAGAWAQPIVLSSETETRDARV